MSDSEDYESGSESEGSDVGDLAAQLAQLAIAAANNPPSRKYYCGVCEEVGAHYVNFCPEAVRTGRRTPYQGEKRMFGRYKCPQCRRLWVSSRSWANATQDCKMCKTAVYPHLQRPLNKGTTVGDPNKEHPQQLCGMCRRLGHACIRKADTTGN